MTDPLSPSEARHADAQTTLNAAVLYALKVGCFFPVPEPTPPCNTDDLVKWGAMRNLHTAIAAFFREAHP